MEFGVFIKATLLEAGDQEEYTHRSAMFQFSEWDDAVEAPVKHWAIQ